MKITIDNELTSKEILDLRKINGLDCDEGEWGKCLGQNIINVSVRNDEGKVVGIGFLCENQRHAELVDLVVHPDYRKQGIGRKIVKFIVNYVLNHKIKYFGLTYNKNYPWLKDFYKSEGFQSIDFAMWHKSSLQ